MKKYYSVLICSLAAVILFVTCLGFNKKNYPNEYYNVYLNSQYLGMVKSESGLIEYISDNTRKIINQEKIVKTYCENELTLDQIIEKEQLKDIDRTKIYKNEENKNCIDVTIIGGTEIEKIYTPNGLEIKKILTYSNELTSNEDMYKKIVQLESFTVKGYQFTISEDDNNKYIYVMDKKVFEDAIKTFIEIYVGKSEYKAYLEGNQLKIETVGSMLENVYIQEDITVKERQISIDNKIYTDANELAQLLIYGKDDTIETYEVKTNEMISDIAFANEISNQEFLISNPKYKNENSLIVAGTKVNIRKTNPQLKVVVEKYSVEDKVVDYKTIYQYDPDKLIGYVNTIQEGSNGLQRINQRLKIVNGDIVYIEPKGKENLKDSVDKIVVKGEKKLPNVGDLDNWGWPSESGWTISSPFGWRIHPITGERSFHNGTDIAGTGYNSLIFSANNGTVIMKEYNNSFGYYIVVNHNNGYYTLYAHLNKYYEGIKVGDTVIRGQKIGYVGSTGQSTGPHIHFEVWKGCQWCRINPMTIY